MNYYNEHDAFAAQWLRELIIDGLIPDGTVDSRSITDVEAKDLSEYTQCHFFAGIGGWSRALELAGWEPSRPVWTGSPPCQPFSSAGTHTAFDDKRDLWFAWYDLIRECRPRAIFGEQVATSIKHGWLDRAATDLAAAQYRLGAIVLQAASVDAPHRRERLFIVADTCDSRLQGQRRPRQEPLAKRRQGTERHRASSSFWGASTIYCRDKKHRAAPLQPEIQPMVDGLPEGLGRVGLLKGAGNAIVPQAAAEIIKAYMEHDNGQS